MIYDITFTCININLRASAGYEVDLMKQFTLWEHNFAIKQSAWICPWWVRMSTFTPHHIIPAILWLKSYWGSQPTLIWEQFAKIDCYAAQMNNVTTTCMCYVWLRPPTCTMCIITHLIAFVPGIYLGTTYSITHSWVYSLAIIHDTWLIQFKTCESLAVQAVILLGASAKTWDMYN